jgi:hypothetical protein
MTGTLLAKMAMTIFRIDSARPPGVSISMMRHEAPSVEALRIPFSTKSAMAGLMEPEIFMIYTALAAAKEFPGKLNMSKNKAGMIRINFFIVRKEGLFF